MITNDLDLTADTIDVRDIIARFEEVEEAKPETEGEKWDLCEEYSTLLELLYSLEGMGGDEQWRGDWYPVTLIRDSHFQDYAQQLAEDIGAVDANATWPNNCIDWEHAARELRYDYSGVDIAGVTYWTR
jgi:hypothetical protein